MTDALVIGRAWEFDPAERIWGTGGWLSPEEREGLDWLTLVRSLGWGVRAATTCEGPSPDVCIVACDPGEVDGSLLLAWADTGSLVVVPVEHAPPELIGGLTVGGKRAGSTLRRRIRSTEAWVSGVAIEHSSLEPDRGWEVWATIDDVPAIVTREVGEGRIAILAFHPSHARDASRTLTDVLVRLLTSQAPTPTAWLDLSGTMILRMDDPGGAQNVYSEQWRYPKLTGSQWAAIGKEMGRRRGRISIAYSSGFVDDGDSQRGHLFVKGSAVDRLPGHVHPAPLVRYEDIGGHSPGTMYDYQEEFRGISALVESDRAGVEIHGHTHLHPDHDAWAAAPDRYENMAWFRELGPAASQALALRDELTHPLVLGYKAIEEWFGRAPTTLVCPGEEWTNEALEVALDLGLSLVGSYYLAMRHDDRFCWTTHVCSPYLDEADAGWFDSPLPVIGYMHDRDLALNGVGWLVDNLAAWERAGATRFIDYGQLASLLAAPVTIAAGERGWIVSVGDDRSHLVDGVKVGARTGQENDDVSLFLGGREVPTHATGSDPIALRSEGV